MSNWDKPNNHMSTIGFLTMYTADYDSDLSDYIHKFDWENLQMEIGDIKDYLEDMLDKYAGNDITEEYDLVGINSNSFQGTDKTKENRHHLFLEWDNDQYVPERSVLEQFNGMIIETGGGIHLIREDNLLSSELYATMKRWNCCGGFTDCFRKKGYATLRVSPKENNNRLKILNNKEGFLYSVYKEFVDNLNTAI